ncbi:hypothetical protein J2T07_000586 [Luteibacter jiangsuensis]|uniref:Uncharacterized protein n=1 Tax=Luteibacter jiangsuensis TaxID=637577 RepID=A0ABT9SWT2_9GAMM|nr:hypothetical protein [Luteibacter jiangsuensis]MDQ0008427.1 hypothetical protein [Luteibacter jiangsuensis]
MARLEHDGMNSMSGGDLTAAQAHAVAAEITKRLPSFNPDRGAHLPARGHQQPMSARRLTCSFAAMSVCRPKKRHQQPIGCRSAADNCLFNRAHWSEDIVTPKRGAT